MDTNANIYQIARNSAGITQEKAAEVISISVESLRLYETGRRVPPNYIVARMGDLYDSQFLIIQHVRAADDLARTLLPDVQPCTLRQAVIRIYRLLRNFVNNHRTDTLIDIAEDGVIDAQERPLYDQIMKELEEIVNVIYALRIDGF